MTQELGNLDPIPLRSIWSHEENDFTPWLADNLDQLSDAVDIELQLVEIEHELPDGRRVDILARDHDDRIVIENQLETSDDDHFVRLLHYGHTTGAKTLLWLAPEFTTLHAETVRWLNSRYKLDLRCIEVSAWRLQDTYAPLFRQLVPNADRTTDTRQYRAFYRPVLRRLASVGFTQVQPAFPTEAVFRWFATPAPNILYGLLYGDPDGNSWAFMLFDDEEGKDPAYQAVASHRDEILAQIPGTAESATDPAGSIWIGSKTPATLDDPYERQEPIRNWMFDRLVDIEHAAAAFMA
jgi:hypothetical protein